jgi:hypothetical protein
MTDITPAQKSALLKLEGFKEIRDQYAKEQKQAGAGKRRMKGNGFWNDVGAWFKSVGTSVNDFLKRTKLISNVTGAILPILAPMGTALLTLNPLAAAASVGAAKATAEGIKSLGYGAKKMHKGKMHGGAIDPSLQALGKFGLNLFSPLAGMAVQTGLDLVNKSGKMRGGELSNKLVINPVGQRLMGKGDDTFGMNGVQQEHTAPMKAGIIQNQKGSGYGQNYRLKVGLPKRMVGAGGIVYGSISSDFGNVKF